MPVPSMRCVSVAEKPRVSGKMLPERTNLETAVILTAIVEARLRYRSSRSAKSDCCGKRDQRWLPIIRKSPVLSAIDASAS